MRAIWKFTLPSFVFQGYGIPMGSKVVHVHEQDGDVCLWVEVETGPIEYEKRFFCVVGTESEIPEGATYIGTAHFSDGTVWHAYEVNL